MSMMIETSRGDGHLWIVTRPVRRGYLTYLWPRRIAATFPAPLGEIVRTRTQDAARAAHVDLVADVDAAVRARLTQPPAPTAGATGGDCA